jgi:beta-mannanase
LVTAAVRALVLAAAVSVALAATPARADAGALRFGAFTTGDPYWGHTHGTDELERATGRHVDIVNWFQSWGGGDWTSSFQPQLFDAVTSGGRTPLLTWEPWAPANGTVQPDFKLERIAAGAFDAYVAGWATRLKALAKPVYLRPMHEMNSDWYPWSGAANGNTAEQYVQAWRRIVDVFRRSGATNVRFVWSPNAVDVPAGNALERYYPGTAYVDVLALDGYNWGAGSPEHGGWQAFSQLFTGAYDRIRALGPQPVWIAEVASSADGGDKAAWVRDMFDTARKMDRLEALVWFNEDKERDWRATPTPEVAAAFAPVADVADVADTVTAAAPDAPQQIASREAQATAPATAAATLRLRLGRRARAGARATVRWRPRNANAVVRWVVSLDGRRVRSLAAKARVARVHIAMAGRHRWTVSGRNAAGRTVVSTTRSFVARQSA